MQSIAGLQRDGTGEALAELPKPYLAEELITITDIWIIILAVEFCHRETSWYEWLMY